MKKIVFILLLLILPVNIFSLTKTYNYSSSEVQNLLMLAKISGTPLLQMVYPVSSDFLLKMLERIDTSKLSSKVLKIYRELRNKISNPPRIYKNEFLSIDGNFSLLGAQFFLGDEVYKYNEMLPFIDINAEVGISDYFYGVFDLGFFPKQFDGFISLGDARLNTIYNISDSQLAYPTTAYGSLGNDVFSFIIGRDKLSSGNGVTGNLLFTENFLYEDFAKFSVYSGFFSYDFTAVSFNYWDYDSEQNKPFIHITDLSSLSKMQYNHKFNAVIADVLSLSLYEGAVVFNSGLLSNLKALNPFMMIHNTLSFYSGTTNNYFGFEIGYPILPKFEVNINTFIDQVKLFSEEEDSGDNSLGVLVNFKGAFEFSNSILEPYFEFMYGSPHLYLKEDSSYYYNQIENKKYYDEIYNWNIDLVGDNYMKYEDETKFIGYPYGGDIWVFSLGAKYFNLNSSNESKFRINNLSADITFRSKGNYGIGKNEDRTISSSHEILPRENSLIFSLGVNGTFFNGIDFGAKIGSVTKWNYQHENVTKSNFQFGLYVNIKVDNLIKNIKKVY